MKVTEVRISPAKGGKVRAFASVVFDDCFIVNDLRVIEGAHPLNSETREDIETKVLEEYESARSSRVIGERAASGGDGKEAKQSPLDRLSAKLFNEEFWTSDAPGRKEIED